MGACCKSCYMIDHKHDHSDKCPTKKKIISFALACIIMCSICIGVSVAIIAGIAYGYNFMMAEFLTLGRSDVFVYVRRGQFGEKPDFYPGGRRQGEEDLFSSNSNDYQDTKVDSNSKPLSDTWRKALDTRRYAEKLTKYSGDIRHENYNYSQDTTDENVNTNLNLTVIHLPRKYSATANPAMPTTMLPDQTDIIMRKFNPIEQVTISQETNAVDTAFYEEADRPTLDHETKSKFKSKHKEKKKNNQMSIIDKGKLIPIQSWSETSTIEDYLTDEVDDDKISKPV